MNQRTLTRKSPGRLARSGISLFEVLISILVAAIGVFGVLVLIPFAVRNAQQGIDRESAINAAKNYLADFQASGYHDPDTWYDDVVDDQTGMVLPGALVTQPMPVTGTNNIADGWPYVIDPVGTATDAAAGAMYIQFPNPMGLPDNCPRLNMANLLDPNATTADGVSLAQARRLAFQPDDLRFLPPDTELGPPRQVYFSMEDVSAARRQYDGRYTSIAVVIPVDGDGRQYRIVTIVGKAGDRTAERVFEVITTTADQMPADMMRLIKADTGAAGTREFEQIAIGGGDMRLSEIATPGQPALDDDQIRSNDWLMLINYYKTAADTDDWDDISIDFHRVIHADRTSPDRAITSPVPADFFGVERVPGSGIYERTFTVTLQGADFDMYRDWDSKMDGDVTDVGTFAVLIPNVLGVYERTLRLEPDSDWNKD